MFRNRWLIALGAIAVAGGAENVRVSARNSVKDSAVSQ
jgi:hypothetical protein